MRRFRWASSMRFLSPAPAWPFPLHRIGVMAGSKRGTLAENCARTGGDEALASTFISCLDCYTVRSVPGPSSHPRAACLPPGRRRAAESAAHTPALPRLCPPYESAVKANLLLTHFGNLKWTHPHGSERESIFRHSERATALICSAMAAQSVPSEEPGIKVAALLFALLTPGSSDGLKNAPIAFAKKTTSCFFAQEE